MLFLFYLLVVPSEGSYSRRLLSSGTCVDGSPGFYYISETTSGAPWLLWLDGPTNPSLDVPMTPSTEWPETIAFSYGPFASSSLDFSTYNKAVLMYCSGDFFLGNKTVNNGYAIMSAWMNELTPLLLNSTVIVAGGATVGALGVVNNFGLIQNATAPGTSISLLLDSPFFTPPITASLQVRDITSNSPSPNCQLNQTHVVYADNPYSFVPCCLDYLCAANSLSTDTRVLLLQSLAYASSVNSALLSSSEDSAKYSSSQIYNLSLTTTRSGALVTTSLRQAANERSDSTSYIAYSCVETPILSPFGNTVCAESGFAKSVTQTYFTADNVQVDVALQCSTATQSLEMNMGDYQSDWSNSPSTWSTIKVAVGPYGTLTPSIEALVSQWHTGEANVRVEEYCQGMNCNPTCTETQIYLKVEPYTHISALAGLFMLVVIIIGIVALCIVYTSPDTEKTKKAGKATPKDLLNAATQMPRDMHGDSSAVISRSASLGPVPIDSVDIPAGFGDMSALSHAMAGKRSLELHGITYWNRSAASSHHPPSLKHISLKIPQGSLVAIIGGSGSGKSTLLELMSGRRDTGAWCGEISVCGKPVSTEWLARNTGIVRQSMSPLVNELTLLQNLEFAAMLRVRGSREFIRNRIDFVLNRLELIEFRDAKTSTLSGGQRKRAEVALELLTQPDILFLDEPTSALDARTALNFMDWIAGVSKNTGSTVILSIHQPREEIWSLFTHVVLLEKGFLVYYGPPFGLKNASSSVNPADLAVELAGNQRDAMQAACAEWCVSTIEGSSSETSERENSSSSSQSTEFLNRMRLGMKRVLISCKIVKDEKNNQSTMHKLTTPAPSGVTPVMQKTQLVPSCSNMENLRFDNGPSRICQIRSFLLRLMAVHPPWKLTMRSAVGLSLLSVLVAALLAAIFWSMDTESVRSKALAFLVLVPAFLSNSFVVSYVCEDMDIFFIERSNYYVTPLCFFIHHILHLTIFIILPFTVFPFVQYFLLWGRVIDTNFNFNTFLQLVGFAQICFIAFLSLFVFSCFLLKGKQSNAMIMNSSLESLFALFSGFLAPLPSLTLAPIRYMTYMSPAMWGYVGVAYSVANVQFPGNCGATSSTEVTCALNQSGNILIYNLGFDELNPITAFIVLVLWSIAFFFLSWLVLARPWDNGAIKLVVANQAGEAGLEALSQIACVEQEKFMKSITHFSEGPETQVTPKSTQATTSKGGADVV